MPTVTVTYEDYGKSETVTEVLPEVHARQLYTLFDAVTRKKGNPNNRWLGHLFLRMCVLGLDLAAAEYFKALGETNQDLYDAALSNLHDLFVPERVGEAY